MSEVRQNEGSRDSEHQCTLCGVVVGLGVRKSVLACALVGAGITHICPTCERTTLFVRRSVLC